MGLSTSDLQVRPVALAQGYGQAPVWGPADTPRCFPSWGSAPIDSRQVLAGV